MFSNISSVSPMTDALQKSKSLDDIRQHRQDRLSCYQIATTSPIVATPKRRHSLNHDRLATIYGWVTTSKTADDSNRRLQTSRSCSHMGKDNKTRMLALFPNKTVVGNIPLQEQQHDSPPPLPIENDPQIFDILQKDTSRFIHYGKSDTTLTSATVEKLIEKLTREMDNEFMMDFFLTFRQFLTPIKLCKLLILRFRWGLMEEDDTDERRLIRIRTFVVIRHWLTHYWTYDFTTSRTLRYMLSTFLTQLQSHPLILASPRDERIIKNLRNVLKKQRKQYQHWSPTSSRRKDSAIGMHCCLQPSPSPPTPPQQALAKVPATTSHCDSWTIKIMKKIKPHASISTPTVNNALCSCNPIHRSASIISNLQSDSCMQQYKSIVLKYRSEIIAQQFCLVERDMLQDVAWDELVELRWRKRSSKRQSFAIDMDDEYCVGVDRLIGYFNMTCQWVSSEVVRSHQLEVRVKVIEKFLRIALKCYQHCNYSTLMQILLGLQSPAVSRLERTWQKVDSCQLDLFEQLKELAKPFRNWKNMRDCMTEAIEQVDESLAVEGVLTENLKDFSHLQGCIPFLGLYLSDLVFVAELPTFIESTEPDDSEESDFDDDDEKEEDDSYGEKKEKAIPKQTGKDRELWERLSQHLVNYNKFRIAASVVKHVLAFQVMSRAYDFKTHPVLYSYLQSLSSLSNADIRKASLACEE